MDPHRSGKFGLLGLVRTFRMRESRLGAHHKPLMMHADFNACSRMEPQGHERHRWASREAETSGSE
jgi:hypothetical protein